MTLRLILSRHAKSSWNDPLCDDFDRVLNERGRGNAASMGRWIAQNGYMPDEVLASSSARAQETWARFAPACPAPSRVTAAEGLYLASAEQILRHLQRANGHTVLIIAHNPGIADFAGRFATAPPHHVDFSRYPTCATTVFDVAASTWSEVGFGLNQVVDFVVPKDL